MAIDTVRKNLGPVSAYAYAKTKGYTGTEAEFAELMASYANVAEQAGDSAEAAAASAALADQHATTAANAAVQAHTEAGTAATQAGIAANQATSAASSAQAAATEADRAAAKAGEAAQSASDLADAVAAANTAKTAAQTAQGLAEDAKTAAETARTGAQTAKAGAETAQAAAEAAQAAAEAVKASIPADYSTLSDDVTDLKSQISDDEDNFVSLTNKTLKSLKLKNNFIYGRYLQNGFANVTTYARNKNPYPAGKYRLSPYAANSYLVFEYYTDTQGGTALVPQYTVSEQIFTASNPFYVTFNSVTDDSKLVAINSNFSVELIAPDTDNLEDKIDNLSQQMDMFEDEINNVSDLFEAIYSVNRYDGTKIDGGYVVPTTGTITSVNHHSYSGWIDISNHAERNIVYSSIHAENAGFSNLRYAFYSNASEDAFISGGIAPELQNDAVLNRDYAEITTPINAKYMRFSLPTINFTLTPNIMIEYGEHTEYYAYDGDATTIKDSALEKNNIIKALTKDESNTIVESMTYGKKPSQATTETLTDGNTLIVENNSIMKNQYIAFIANISGVFSGVTIGHGQESYGYGIKVDDTNMTYWSNGATGTSVPHGLTIEEFIGVIIEVDVKLNVKTTIITKGGYFTKSQQINSSWRGNVFATSNETTFENAALTWNTNDYKCPLWAFGDSYFTLYSPTRWPYYITNIWGFNNILLNAFPGENSERAYEDLTNALTHGTPKYLLWCLGMNDPDGSSAPNATWLEKVQSIIEICNQKGITLILTTIPNVTNSTYKNTYKNTWIRNSGIRYVDFANALAEINWWLSDDGVHPNEIGGRYMALKLLADVPEITQGK